jgi:hypothetical protein
MRLPAQAARQLPDQSTTLRVDSSSTDDSRLRGALPLSDICTAANSILSGNFAQKQPSKKQGAALLAALETVVVGQPLSQSSPEQTRPFVSRCARVRDRRAKPGTIGGFTLKRTPIHPTPRSPSQTVRRHAIVALHGPVSPTHSSSWRWLARSRPANLPERNGSP